MLRTAGRWREAGQMARFALLHLSVLAVLFVPFRWSLVGWVITLGTVVPFTLTLMALGALGATRTGLVATTEPVFAGIVAWIVLGESLDPVQLFGAAVIMAGILLAETSRRPRTAAARSGVNPVIP